ncbi:MAG: hypothetical protein LBC99_09635 [Spirochaetota bacterium]|jgi:hypothetical protein|nr:hypothetical protein [Spirochaetota bacterium]
MQAKTVILILLIVWAVFLIIANSGQTGLILLPGVSISMPTFIFGLIFLVIGYFLPVLLRKK